MKLHSFSLLAAVAQREKRVWWFGPTLHGSFPSLVHERPIVVHSGFNFMGIYKQVTN